VLSWQPAEKPYLVIVLHAELQVPALRWIEAEHSLPAARIGGDRPGDLEDASRAGGLLTIVHSDHDKAFPSR
jgi:hypothetical protein